MLNMWYQMKGNIMISFTKYSFEITEAHCLSFCSMLKMLPSVMQLSSSTFITDKGVLKRELFQLVPPKRMHTICLFIPNTIYKHLISHLQWKCCPSPLMLCPAEGMKQTPCLEGTPQSTVLDVIHGKPIIV